MPDNVADITVKLQPDYSLTPDELFLCEHLSDCASDFAALPVLYPEDLSEFVVHIHALQNMIMARAVVRTHEEFSRALEKMQ